jgi:hypothetical protein
LDPDLNVEIFPDPGESGSPGLGIFADVIWEEKWEKEEGKKCDR